MQILTDTERNLQNLQSTIDSLAADLSKYNCADKYLYKKAAICEALGRLIRTKEELQGKIQRTNSIILDKVSDYILQRGVVGRRTLTRSGCVRGGSKVIDQALEVLHELGYLEVTGVESGRKQDLCYSLHLPEKLFKPESMPSKNINSVD